MMAFQDFHGLLEHLSDSELQAFGMADMLAHALDHKLRYLGVFHYLGSLEALDFAMESFAFGEAQHLLDLPQKLG